MNLCNRRELKQEAKNALGQAACNPGKLILIHSGASMILSIILSVVSHLLQMQIDDTGGLGGVGMRSVLETAELVLTIGQMVVLIFWDIGYIYASMEMGKGHAVGPKSLLEGFRHFGPVLRLKLLVVGLCAGIVFAATYLSSMIFALTPWGGNLMEAMEIGTEEALMAAMEANMLPLMAIFTVVMAVLYIPYHYRLRMADYFLMDNPKMGAMMAVRCSRVAMHKQRMNLFKLDLSFWWFYGLQLLTVIVGYGDMILPLFGVKLPWSSEISFYVFLVVCYGLQLALYWWKGNEVQVTYALAYESLLPEPEETEKESIVE